MFPYRDENPAASRAVVTIGIIVLTCLAWVFLQGLGTRGTLVASVCQFGLVPAELLGRPPVGPRICPPGVAALSWGAVLTSMFMHGGWFHLIGNMWFLWVFGDNVEDVMGHGRFLGFYLVAGAAAALAQALSAPSSSVPMVGASGAISGVMGAYLMLFPRVRIHTLIFLGFFVTTLAVPAWVILGYWFLLQFLGGLPTLGGMSQGGVAFWAHVGGFVAGVGLIKLFINPDRLAAQRRLAKRELARPRWWR